MRTRMYKPESAALCTNRQSIDSAAVVGAGTMGVGIVGVERVLRAIRRFAERDPDFGRVSLVLVEAARSGRFQ
jgi:hypothetical protein